MIRDDLEGKTDNHCFDWETGDEAATEAVFAKADVVVSRTSSTRACTRRRWRPAAASPTTSASAASSRCGRPARRRTPTAPSTRWSSGLPEHKIRVIAPDIGGGFGNKVPIYPGYVCAIVASLVIGKPVKWMEDRTENLVSTGFARDYVMRGEIAATKDGKILAIRTNVLADHGAFNGTAAPMKYPAGFFGVFTGSYDLEAAYCYDDRGLHQQGSRRRRLRLLVPDHRGRLPRRADRRLPRLRAGDGSGRAAEEELHPARAVPVHHQDRLGLRLRRVRDGAGRRARDGRVRRAAARAGGEAGQAAS